MEEYRKLIEADVNPKQEDRILTGARNIPAKEYYALKEEVTMQKEEACM